MISVPLTQMAMTFNFVSILGYNPATRSLIACQSHVMIVIIGRTNVKLFVLIFSVLFYNTFALKDTITEQLSLHLLIYFRDPYSPPHAHILLVLDCSYLPYLTPKACKQCKILAILTKNTEYNEPLKIFNPYFVIFECITIPTTHFMYKT